MSSQKKLLACGCSYTKHLTTWDEQREQFDTRTILTKDNNTPNIPTYWPELVANDLGLDYLNTGEPGAGNDRIFNNDGIFRFNTQPAHHGKIWFWMGFILIRIIA